MAENQSRAGKPFGEIMMKNSPICMAPRELAEVCQKKKIVVLVSRNDKENSEYAAEVCEYVKQNNSNDILYFSLKLKSDEFKSLHPELTVEVNDTPALSIDELENIEKSRNNSSKMSMIVINDLYVRNFIEHAIGQQAARLLGEKEDASKIQSEELFLITRDDISMLEKEGKKEREAGTAKKELDEMVGLSSVKRVIHKAIANYKLNKLCIEKGIPKRNASLHMVFTGNPGTAKTTVARLFAEIMKDENILSTGNFVEAGRADLIGDHVGSTAPMIKKKFKEAQGGILFIDEAYAFVMPMNMDSEMRQLIHLFRRWRTTEMM